MKRKEQLERFRGMNADELKEEVDRLKESVFRASFRRSLGENEAGKNIRAEKKMLARVKTLIRQNETTTDKTQTAK